MKQFHAVAERSKAAVAEALRPFLPATGTVLELGSGSGQMIVHLAEVFPALAWQPSDRDPGALASIEAWRAGDGTVRAPLRLDVTDPAATWPPADAILASHLLHVLDAAGQTALFAGAARALRPGGRLFLFGPLSGVTVDAPFAALAGSVWCPVVRIPDRATAVAAAARQGLEEQAAVELADGVLLVLARGAL